MRAFASSVTPFLSAANRYKARQLSTVVATHYSPVAFSGMLGRMDLGALVGKSLRDGPPASEFTNDDIEAIRKQTRPFIPDEHADVDVLAAQR